MKEKENVNSGGDGGDDEDFNHMGSPWSSMRGTEAGVIVVAKAKGVAAFGLGFSDEGVVFRHIRDPIPRVPGGGGNGESVRSIEVTLTSVTGPAPATAGFPASQRPRRPLPLHAAPFASSGAGACGHHRGGGTTAGGIPGKPAVAGTGMIVVAKTKGAAAFGLGFLDEGVVFLRIRNLFSRVSGIMS